MYYEDERNAIESRFKTKWEASVYAAVPICYDNYEFDAGGQTFVTCYVMSANTGEQKSLGSPAVHRYYGSIINDVLVKVNSGTKAVREMSDVICEIWRNAQFSKNNSGRILCRTPSILPLRRRGDYFQLQVQTSFLRDVSLVTQPAG